MAEVRRVTKIPATLAQYTASPIAAPKKRRVGAYARVSTDHEEQLTSLSKHVTIGSLSTYIPMKALQARASSTGKGSNRWCRMPWMEESI